MCANAVTTVAHSILVLRSKQPVINVFKNNEN